MRTFTGAQTCTVENGSTFTTAIGKAAEGAEGAAAELVAGKVICAADGTAANTAMHAVTAIRRQPRVVHILLVAKRPKTVVECKAVDVLRVLGRWRFGSILLLQKVLLSEAIAERSYKHAQKDMPRVVGCIIGTLQVWKWRSLERILPSKSDNFGAAADSDSTCTPAAALAWGVGLGQSFFYGMTPR